MKYNNKMFKLVLRYIKETNKYSEFVKNFKHYVTTNECFNNVENIIKTQCGNSPLELLRIINIKGECRYNSPAEFYIFKNFYEKEIKTLFENFLKEKQLYENFIKNIDENFILRHSTKKTFKNYPKNKLKTLYENLCPTGFIMNAFLWEDAKEKTTKWSGWSGWSSINNEWEIKINKFFKEI